jgi:hypothetical protein
MMSRSGIGRRSESVERGAGSVEYIGSVLVVGMLTTALLVTGSCTPRRSPPVPDFDRLRSLLAPPRTVPGKQPVRPPAATTRRRAPTRPRKAPERPRVEVPKWAIGR